MANGKGALACMYCRHVAYPRCGFHGVPLPESPKGWNTICGNFEPTDLYWQHSGQHGPPGRRFGWFGIDLKPGVLYHFQYNEPRSIEQLSILRKPDYEGGDWKGIGKSVV